MKTTVVPRTPCAACGKELARATSIANHKPKPGDWSFCAECYQLNVFDDDMRLRKATPAERKEFVDSVKALSLDSAPGAIAHALLKKMRT